ncbi:MAG: ABC transporter permease [Sphingomonadales bacterium]
MPAAEFRLLDREEGRTLCLSGDWTAVSLGKVPEHLASQAAAGAVTRIDLADLGRADTAGVLALLQCLGEPAKAALAQRDDLRHLAGLVEPALHADEARRLGARGLWAALDRGGRAVIELGSSIFGILEFTGRLMVAVVRSLVQPRRIRGTALVAMMEDVGVTALPIVFVMTFFVGAVIALIGTNILRRLGVEVFTVEMVGIGILREFGIVVASILLAGRSASAFAAQIGAMRMNQEVDAMQVMGVDRFDALVVPRVLAVLLMMPILTFCADVGGISGGLLVSWISLDINPAFFLQRTLENVHIHQFWIGMSKAPFLGLLVAAVGCRHGLLVEGDVQSLGHHVTSAVVESVFLIIMFDAIFAMIFTVLDL